MIQQFSSLAIAPTTQQYYTSQYLEQIPQNLLQISKIISLDSLIIHNFKSFKSQHYVGPFLNFTSIIGPNGSGKTNILQAIIFCVGGQKLKGQYFDIKEFINRKQDQTFSQLNKQQRICFVECRFATLNQQYLHLKRSINPNGQSKYQINFVTYPYKLYIEFCKRHNIRSDVCNFGIWQGQTDRLILKQPNQLRLHLQRLCGSIQLKEIYQSDKNELQLVKKNIQQNTSKMTKLKIERKNIKQIKSSTTEYTKQQQKYNQLLQTQVATKLLFKHIQINNLDHEIQKKQKQEKGMIKHLNQKKAQAQKQFKLSLEMKAELNKLIDEVAKLNNKYKNLNKQNNIIKMQTLKQMKEQIKRDQQFKQVLEHKLKEVKNKIPQVRQSKQMEQYLQCYSQWQKQNYMMKSQINKKEINLANLERLIQSKQNIINNYKQKKNKYGLDKTQNIKKIQRLTNSIKEIEVLINKSKNQFNIFQQSIKDNKVLIKNKQQQLLKIQGHIQQLQQKILEGIQQTKQKQICRKLLPIPGFKGILSQKIKPINNKYLICFSILMNSINKYLLATNQQASKILAVKLKELNQLKTVVILQNVKQSKDQQGFRKLLSNRCIPAIDIVDYDRDLSGFGHFLQSFLKGKVICQTIDEAFKVSQQKIRGIKQIYSLDGEVIRDDGMISSYGNSQKLKKNYKFDAEVQRKIEKQIMQLKQLKLKVQEQMKKIKIKNTDAQIAKRLQDISKLQVKKQQISDQMMRYKNYKPKQSQNVEFLETELADLKNKKQHLIIGLQKVEKMIQTSNVFKDFMKKYNISNVQSFRNSKDVTELQNKLRLKNSCLNQIRDIQNQLKKIQNKNLNQKIGDLQTQINNSIQQQNQHSLQKLILQKQQHIIQLRTRLSKLNFNVDTKWKSEIPELQEKKKYILGQLDIQLKELNQQYNLNIIEPNYQKVLTLLKAKKQNLNKNMLETLLVKLGLERKKIQQQLEKYNSLDLMRGFGEGLESLQKKIQQIEKYLDQLIKKRENISKNLKQCSEKRKNIFNIFFQKLKITLAQTYKFLTSTLDPKIFGNADLYLENQDLPFQHGIYFSPTPPTKRFVYDIQQLSGGQKSIASLALQYSIALVTNSPFLILDQIDAFLDNENVDKLLNLIKKSQQEKKFQFIIISHKYFLLENSQSLVGIANIDSTSRAYSLRV